MRLKIRVLLPLAWGFFPVQGTFSCPLVPAANLGLDRALWLALAAQAFAGPAGAQPCEAVGRAFRAERRPG